MTTKAAINVEFPRSEQYWQAVMSYAEGHALEFQANGEQPCMACGGSGQQAALDGEALRHCYLCKGTGRQAVSAIKPPPELFNNEAFDIMRGAIERAAAVPVQRELL